MSIRFEVAVAIVLVVFLLAGCSSSQPQRLATAPLKTVGELKPPSLPECIRNGKAAGWTDTQTLNICIKYAGP